MASLMIYSEGFSRPVSGVVYKSVSAGCRKALQLLLQYTVGLLLEYTAGLPAVC